MEHTIGPALTTEAAPRILTASELAKLRKVSKSYICRLCRLPENHPKHIKNVKVNSYLYWITDKAILAEYPGQFCMPS